MLGLSVPIEDVVISVLVFGSMCVNYSRYSVRRRGRLPWGINPWIWGLIGALFGLFGLILLFIAVRTTKPPMNNPYVQGPFGQGPYGEAPYGQPPQFGQQGWAPPAPPPDWNARPLPAPPPGGEAVGAPPAAAPVLPAPLSLGREVDMAALIPQPPADTAAGWLADPKDGQRYRYFDGSRWTEWISTESSGVLEDPL